MDYNAKIREARSLIDRGQYTLAVVALGTILENIYMDFYAEVKGKLPPAQQQLLIQREMDFTAKGDKTAREKGFSGLSLGGKTRFFADNRIVEEAERLFNKLFQHFKAFDPRLFTSIRNEAAHQGDLVVDEDEANLFHSQVRVLLMETGLLKKAEPTAPDTAAVSSALRSWKENGVVPHENILHGNLELSAYAADLWGVARNDAHTPTVTVIRAPSSSRPTSLAPCKPCSRMCCASSTAAPETECCNCVPRLTGAKPTR
jgi:hypothetical protein